MSTGRLRKGHNKKEVGKTHPNRRPAVPTNPVVTPKPMARRLRRRVASTEELLQLQSILGNRAVSRMISGPTAQKETAAGEQLQMTAETAIQRQSAPGPRPTLYPGSRDEAVTALQHKLRATRRTIAITGVYDAQTKENVLSFQEQMRLKTDGIVGRRTWEALDAYARGGALSEADMVEVEAKYKAAGAVYEAEQYEEALSLYMDIYRDPRYAMKPLLIANVVWNIATCYHHLAFGFLRTEQEKQEKLNTAISYYQEFLAREGLSKDMIAEATIRIREARLGEQPPSSVKRMGQAKDEMGGTPGMRSTLYPGMKGSDVTLLQQKLRATRRNIAITGVYDAQTKESVLSFQEQMRLKTDGIVGRQTWEALDAYARGGALSEADMVEVEAKFKAAGVVYEAEQYEEALSLYMDIYRDPRYAMKPLLIANVLWNIATCYHQLAFGFLRTEAEKKGKLNTAISYYQEFLAREGLSKDMIAETTMRIQEARIGERPPTSVKKMLAAKYEMG